MGAPPLNEPEQYGDFALVAGVLSKMGILPDFESNASLRYTHRRDGGTDIYFVANAEDRSLEADCVFRVAGKGPELWDAVTGEIRRLNNLAVRDGRTSVPLRFEPYQSFFIVFRRPLSGGIPAGRNFPERQTAAEIAGPWEVSFDPKWGGPEKVIFERLEDWSGRPEEGIRFYSGKAHYRKTFDLAGETRRLIEGFPTRANSVAKTGRGGRIRTWLDLGTVKCIARVRLNGRDLGVVWCAPWHVDITGVVEPSGNRLEVEVANLWPNRLIGDEQLAPDCEYGEDGRLARWPAWLLNGEHRPRPGRIAFTTWKHYAKDSPLVPSGLLGPITIRVEIPAS